MSLHVGEPFMWHGEWYRIKEVADDHYVIQDDEGFAIVVERDLGYTATVDGEGNVTSLEDAGA